MRYEVGVDARADRAERAAIAIGLIGLVAWSVWARYRFLASSPYPMGVDGYFYPIQLRSILEHGHLQYPASPLAFYLMAPLAWLTDPITGAKLGAAIGGALIAFPAYAVGARLGGNRAGGIAAAVIATTSVGSWYLSVEFVKNGWGLTAALTAVWMVLRAIERPAIVRIAIAVLATVAAGLTHKMAAVLVVAIGGCAIVGELVDRGRPWRRLGAEIALGLGGIAAVALAAALIWPERFIAARELGEVTRLFTSTGHGGAPALYLDSGRFVLHMGYEALAAGVVALVALAILIAPRFVRVPWWTLVERPSARRGTALAVIAFAIVIALPWINVGDPQGLGFRIRIMAFVPLSLVAAVVVGELVAQVRIPPLAGRALAGVLVAAVIVFRPHEPAGVVRAHPAMVAAAEALAGAVPRGDTVIVTERHIEYMAAYYARVPVKLDPASIPPARRWRLMPLAFIGRRDDSLYRLLMTARATAGIDAPRGLHPRDPNGLVLVPEATWTWIVDRLPPRVRTHYREWHTI